MRNPCTDYKILLDTFTYEEQIDEINRKINELLNEKQYGNIKDNRYERIKVLKQMKNNIINRSQYSLKKNVLTKINSITYDNEKTTTSNIFNS